MSGTTSLTVFTNESVLDPSSPPGNALAPEANAQLSDTNIASSKASQATPSDHRRIGTAVFLRVHEVIPLTPAPSYRNILDLVIFITCRGPNQEQAERFLVNAVRHIVPAYPDEGLLPLHVYWVPPNDLSWIANMQSACTNYSRDRKTAACG
ncbi:hypothetical protein GCK32_011827 [Trichostrongylus colubriformis]|uniref:Uncharacterized protein n=1 Tax=Trichostrongylus colubriformis TaxID=6319 RepID=A0AAN8G1F3_TRICO